MTETRYTSLLFKTQEYHRIGPFRFPIYKDLLPGEVRALEEVNRSNAKATFQTLKLAKSIAAKRGLKPSEAVALLGNLGSEDNQDLVFEFADELEESQRTGITVVEQQAATVTAFMKYRAEAAFPENPDLWEKTTDWTSSDTDMMPTAMMQEVFDFITWERDGWPSGNSKEHSPKMKST